MSEQQEIIKFSEWKKALTDKWVRWTWTKIDNTKTSEFEACRFYASVYKDQISMPNFGIQKNQKFIKLDDKTYRTESEYGSTIYEILGETKPCYVCNSVGFITKKLRQLECNNPEHKNTKVIIK